MQVESKAATTNDFQHFNSSRDSWTTSADVLGVFPSSRRHPCHFQYDDVYSFQWIWGTVILDVMLHRCQAVKCDLDLKICKSICCLLDCRRAGSVAFRTFAPKLLEQCSLQRPVLRVKVRARPSYSLRRNSTMAAAGNVFFLDEFAIRQWDDPSYSGTRISYSKDGFVQKLHELHAQA